MVALLLLQHAPRSCERLVSMSGHDVVPVLPSCCRKRNGRDGREFQGREGDG